MHISLPFLYLKFSISNLQGLELRGDWPHPLPSPPPRPAPTPPHYWFSLCAGVFSCQKVVPWSFWTEFHSFCFMCCPKLNALIRAISGKNDTITSAFKLQNFLTTSKRILEHYVLIEFKAKHIWPTCMSPWVFLVISTGDSA